MFLFFPFILTGRIHWLVLVEDVERKRNIYLYIFLFFLIYQWEINRWNKRRQLKEEKKEKKERKEKNAEIVSASFFFFFSLLLLWMKYDQHIKHLYVNDNNTKKDYDFSFFFFSSSFFFSLPFVKETHRTM
jgi:hypothetical protein